MLEFDITYERAANCGLCYRVTVEASEVGEAIAALQQEEAEKGHSIKIVDISPVD